MNDRSAAAAGRRRSVVHVLEALEGGTARHLVDVVTHARGWEHHVAIPARRVGAPTDRLAAFRLAAAGAEVHLVAMRRHPLRADNLVAAARLLALVRRVRPAVVHGHSSVGGALGRIVGTAARLPRVYTPNGLWPGRAALAVERGLGCVTDRLVAVSDSEAALVARLRMVPPARLVTIPNGVLPDPVPVPGVDLRRRLGLAEGTPLVGSVARLVTQKAPERLVAVAARVTAASDAHVVLIGDGPLRGAFDSARHQAGLDGRLHVVADLAHAAAVVDQLDVFVLTSRFEGGPYAPLEAMRASTPVVLTDVVGSRDVVEDGVSGFLVPEGDQPAMADRVLMLLADAGRRQLVGAAGRRRVIAAFDVRTLGDRLAALYDELTS